MKTVKVGSTDMRIYTTVPAVICDIDGTLAHKGGRDPYSDTGHINDELNPNVRAAFAKLGFGNKKILLSGRKEICRKETEEWLKKHMIEYDELYMRANGDNRADDIVKRELYEKHVKPKHEVFCVLDDRNRVVKMWRELGLTCLQVADGDF